MILADWRDNVWANAWVASSWGASGPPAGVQLGHWQDDVWAAGWVAAAWRVVAKAPEAVGGTGGRRKRRYLIETERGPLLVDEDRRIINEEIPFAAAPATSAKMRTKKAPVAPDNAEDDDDLAILIYLAGY